MAIKTQMAAGIKTNCGKVIVDTKWARRDSHRPQMKNKRKDLSQALDYEHEPLPGGAVDRSTKAYPSQYIAIPKTNSPRYNSFHSDSS
jgi:hypothetical protein